MLYAAYMSGDLTYYNYEEVSTCQITTYTANFTTSSNVQLISNIPFTHLFVLIIYGITTHIGHKHHSQSHTSYFTPNTQRKVYHSSPLHTYKVQIHIHYRYI